MTLGPTATDDPTLLVRGYDVCARSYCLHQRRWHAPCTQRLGEQDQLRRCGCPEFLTTEQVQAEGLALAEASERSDQLLHDELHAHEELKRHGDPQVHPLTEEG